MQDFPTKSKKRILKDRRELLKNPLHEFGIYIEFDEDNMKYAHVLIIGPPETRYEKGFYLFHIEYPNNYPFSPMKLAFLTSNGKTRMNPNLYVNGKVCISILGTWSGPGWTSCQTTKSVLLSLLTLFNMNPINNEPGYTDYAPETDIAKNYNKIIDYQNMYLAVYKMTKRNPHPCPPLQLIMANYVKENYEWYISKIKENMIHDNQLITMSVYKLSEKLKYQELLTKFNKLNDYVNNLTISKESESGTIAPLDNVSSTIAPLDKESGTIEPVEKESGTKQTKKGRKAPTKPSGNFEIGYKMISENDAGCYYVVKKMNHGSRWIKCT
jgi:ubiquitin-protein ligase